MPVSLRTLQRQQLRRRRFRRGVKATVVALFIITGLWQLAPWAFQSGHEQWAIAQLHARQEASPTPSTTPSATPTPIATPSPTPIVDWQTWQLGTATISAPEVGIVDAPIHEILPEELVPHIVFDDQGNASKQTLVEPNTKTGFTWYTVTENGLRVFPVGGTISSQRQGPVVLYCHNYRDGSSVCSNTRKTDWRPAGTAFQVGDQMTITTDAEVLTFRLESIDSLRKAAVSGNDGICTGTQVCIITCDSEGDYDSSNNAEDNTIFRFVQVSSVTR